MKNTSFLFLLILLASCGGKKIPNVSKIDVDIKLIRFDKDLDELRKQSCTYESIQNLKKKHPIFAEIYFSSITNIARTLDTTSTSYIQNFIMNKDISDLHKDVNQNFDNLYAFKEEITQAFKFYKHYFPKKEIPNVITYVYGFDYSVVAIDSNICIALDQYLGKGAKYYEHLPDYIRYQKEKQFMVRDAMKGWISSEIETTRPRKEMVDEMIHLGKIQYILDLVLPTTPDSIRFGFTSDQTKFCNQNEMQIWTHFINNKLLYSKDQTLISKYCQEAPFSAGMPKESPGRTGEFIGYKIVTAYMTNNPNISLEQLLLQEDAKLILNNSKYKPKK